MNSVQISVFLTVAEHMSVSAAAQELFLAPPAVSRYISALEKELDVALFSRKGNRLSLTGAGVDFLDFFSLMKRNLDELCALHRITESYEPLTLRYSSFPGWDISDILRTNAVYIRTKYPDWDITCEYLSTDSVVEALRKGKVDIIFYYPSRLANVKDIANVPLASIPELILFSDNHPLAAKVDLTPEDFADSQFLFMIDYALTQEHLELFSDAILELHGFRPKIELMKDMDSLMLKVEAGEGVICADYWMRHKKNVALRYVTTKYKNSVVLAYNTSNINPIVKLFVHETTRFFERHAGEFIPPDPAL